MLMKFSYQKIKIKKHKYFQIHNFNLSIINKKKQSFIALYLIL